jgi:integrase
MKKKYVFTKVRGKKGLVYYFYYYDAQGKRIRKSTGKSLIGEAWEFADSFMAELAEKDKPGVPTLREYAADFFDWERSEWIRRQHAKGRAFSKATAQMRAIHLDNHILPEFGDRPLTEINRVDVENWLIGLDLSNQTKNHILYTFRIILRDAEAAGKLDSNPLEKVEPMGKDAQARDILSLEELRLLFPKTNTKLMKVWKEPRRAALFAILATVGLRSGEVRALKWENAIEECTDCPSLRN